MDLQIFCGDRPKIKVPWSKGEYTYATNGYLIVRVPRMPEITNEKGVPIGNLRFDQIITEWLTPTFKRVKLFKCPMCGGKGTAYGETCDNCDGRKKVWPPTETVINKIHFGTHLLQLVADLPGFKIARPVNDISPCKFIFDGGDGLIMPARYSRIEL